MATVLRSIEELRDERLKQLYRYWDGKRGGRQMPGRSDIDPVDLAYCLGYLCLIEVEPGEPPRFRFRVDGSNCALMSGIEMTGRYVDDIPPSEYRTVMETAYREIYRTKLPHFYADDEVWDGRRYQTEGLLLPLSSDNKTVNMMIDVVLPRPIP